MHFSHKMQCMNSNYSVVLTLANVGNTIRAARKSQKLSQTKLGKMAGLSRMPVYRLEAGQDVSLNTLLSILSALRLGLHLSPLPEGVPSVEALHNAFSHLHAEESE